MSPNLTYSPHMAAYRRPTSRTANANADAKRAPTQLLPPVRPAGSKTTVKLASPQAPPTPEAEELLADELPDLVASPPEAEEPKPLTNPFAKSVMQPAASAAAPVPTPAPAPRPVSKAPPAPAPAPAKSLSTPKALAKTTIIANSTTPVKNQALAGATPPPASTASPHRAHTENRLRRAESSKDAKRSSARLPKGSSKRVVEKKPRGKPRTWPVYVIIAMVVLLVICGLCWKPYERHEAVQTMDAAKTDPRKHDAAMQAADSWLALVEKDPAEVDTLVANDHGPLDVQIHLVAAVGLFPRLVTMAERSDISPHDRALVLAAAAQLYDPGRDASQRLPARLDDLISDDSQPDELATAAMVLIAKAGRQDALASLVRVAIAASSRPARSNAALQALAGMITNLNVAEVMPLFTSPARARVVANADFCTAVATVCSSEMDRIEALAFGDDAAVRLFALGCLADHCALPDVAGNEARRADLTTRITPLLTKTTPPDVLSPALRIASHLLLVGTAPQLLAISPDVDGLSLPGGVNSDLIKKTLGQAFILTATPEDKAHSDQIVAMLGNALSDPRTRPIAAGALKLITSSTDLPSLRTVLDQLATAGDPDSMDALKAIVTTAYNRPDVVKSEGDDGAAWLAFLAKERQLETRYDDIKSWLKDNGKYLRVADGSRRLQTSITFLQKAADETKSWVADPDFVAPLGLAKNDVPDLVGDLNMMMADVKHALAGAEQDTDQSSSPPPAAAAPADAPAAAPAPAPADAPAGGDTQPAAPAAASP